MNNISRSTVFIGVDLGTSLKRKSTGLAYLVETDGKPRIESRPNHIVSKDEEIQFCIKQISENFKSIVVAIDAPLSKPENGAWRECEKKLHELGIPCYPSGAEWTCKWVEKGINLKEWVENQLDATVIEVYPYGARIKLDIGANEKKKTKQGRRVIQEVLSGFIGGLSEITGDKSKDMPLSDDELDALLSAYTAYCKVNANVERFSGKDGTIYLPLKIL